MSGLDTFVYSFSDISQCVELASADCTVLTIYTDGEVVFTCICFFSDTADFVSMP